MNYTQEDFLKAIESAETMDDYHNYAAQKCYDLAMKIAEEAFNAARKTYINSRDIEACAVETTEWKYDEFEDYQYEIESQTEK